MQGEKILVAFQKSEEQLYVRGDLGDMQRSQIRKFKFETGWYFLVKQVGQFVVMNVQNKRENWSWTQVLIIGHNKLVHFFFDLLDVQILF